MTENQTNLPSQPTEPDKNGEQHVPDSPKKRGRFASDGTAPRRTAQTGTSARFTSPDDAPSGSVPAPEQSAVGKRIEDGGSGIIKSTETAPLKKSLSATPAVRVLQPVDAPFEKMRLFLLAVIMVPLCAWASFPAWGRMIYEWRHTDDYSHGWLVIPATIFFLYIRRETYPGTSYKFHWVGLFPLLIYGLLRISGGMMYIEIVDEYAIWFWILSVVWFFYGWRVFLWALPSLCFLVFMFQLPWTIDTFMKNHLQQFAAQFAAAILTMIGETAFPIRNTIHMAGGLELGVEDACSGLRLLMSVFAIAFAAVLLLQRPWWQNVLFMAIAAPLALFVNAVRITITGWLLVHYHDFVAARVAEGQTAAELADAWAGKVSIALVLALFVLFIWYLGKAFRRVEI